MTIQKNIGLSLGLIGLLVLCLNSIPFFENTTLLFALCFLSMTLGGILYFKALYGSPLAGIKNDGVWFNALTSKGIWGWILGLVLTGFYIAIYWFPELLGYRTETASVGLVAFFDPLSIILNGNPATQWFMYGTLYTFAIALFGIKFLWKYRSNPYQIFRTLSIIFFQLCFAFFTSRNIKQTEPRNALFF